MNMETNKILIIVLVVNILLIGVIAYFMQQAINECLGNPLLYGAEKFSKSNNAEFSCSCSLAVPNSPLIFFDSEFMSVEYPNRIRNLDDIKGLEVKNVG